MAITGCIQTYFVVWTGKGLPLIEKIVFAQDHWDKIRSSVILFFKTFLQNVLFRFKSIYTCPVCSKYILEVDHHAGADDEIGITCEKCMVWYHYSCCGFKHGSNVPFI